jgi:anti-sigma factor RsiW
MTMCTDKEMRDLLPDYVHGHLDAARAAEVREHVASCSECAAELELLNEVVASVPLVPEMDVDRIVSALPTSTRHGLLLHRGGAVVAEAEVRPITSVSASRRMWSRPLVRVAAAVAIVTAGGLSLMVGRDVLRPEMQVGQRSAAIPSTEIAAAPAASLPVSPAPAAASPTEAAPQRETVVASSTGLSLAGEVQELSDEHLATLVDEIAKMDVLPAEEPEPMEQGIGGADSTRGIDQ